MRPFGWPVLVLLSSAVGTAWGLSVPHPASSFNAQARALAPRATTIPAPIVVPASQYWDGDAGQWSSFAVRVGTPAQTVRVFLSTAATNTWVVIPEGCGPGSASSCVDARGDQFNDNSSSTWVPVDSNSIFNLGLEENLGYHGNGQFGFDTVGLGWPQSGGPTLDRQVVAGIATEDFSLGIFGLTPRPTNFTTFNDPQASFLETLKNKSMVPSLSWGYTAGAPYRQKKVLGSLTLGGYDASRFTPGAHSFTFGPDQSRDLLVGIQAITMTPSNSTTKTPLLPTGILALIDSTVPDIWLPVAACQAFEAAFNLTYNSTTGLYLVPPTLHNQLLAQNATLTFTLGDTISGGPTTEIVLPYASFDLQFSSHPTGGNSSFFPLRRAANDSQYTLGRTFLQETYLVVDYERANFTLAQALFPAAPGNSSIQPILSPTEKSSAAPHDAAPGGLTKGAIIGVVVAGLLFLALVLALVIFFRRRRAAILAEPPPSPPPKPDDSDLGDHHELPAPRRDGKSELDATGNVHVGHEVDGTGSGRAELGSPGLFGAGEEAGIHELPTHSRAEVYELNADESALRAELPAPGPGAITRRSSTAKDAPQSPVDGGVMDTLAEEADPPPRWEEIEVPRGGMPQPVITLPEPGSRPGSRYSISVPDLRAAAAAAADEAGGAQEAGVRPPQQEQGHLAPRDEPLLRPGSSGSGAVPSLRVTKPDGEEGTLSTDGFGTDSFRQAIQGMGVRVPLPVVVSSMSSRDGDAANSSAGVSPLGSPAPTDGGRRSVSPPGGDERREYR